MLTHMPPSSPTPRPTPPRWLAATLGRLALGRALGVVVLLVASASLGRRPTPDARRGPSPAVAAAAARRVALHPLLAAATARAATARAVASAAAAHAAPRVAGSRAARQHFRAAQPAAAQAIAAARPLLPRPVLAPIRAALARADTMAVRDSLAIAVLETAAAAARAAADGERARAALLATDTAALGRQVGALAQDLAAAERAARPRLRFVHGVVTGMAAAVAVVVATAVR